MIDLHLHTTASDGVLSPRELVERALERSLEVIAVTDHDTVAGVAEALERARGEPIEVVPGIEVSASSGSQDLHVLGLFVDHTSPALGGYAAAQASSRRQRIEAIVARLAELGLDITMEEVSRRSSGCVPGRPHVARVLLEKGVVCTLREAFNRFLVRGALAWVPYPRPTPAQAFELIRSAGGLPLIAHPGLDDLEGHLLELIAEGAVGFEVYHPDHAPDTVDRLLALAREHGLLMTGGSDYHGYQDDGIPGRGMGETPLPRVAYQALRARAGWPD